MSNSELVGIAAGQLLAVAVQAVQFVGFWTSVSLPLLYVPLLADGLEAGAELFAGLVALHVVSLVLCHEYGRNESAADVT